MSIMSAGPHMQRPPSARPPAPQGMGYALPSRNSVPFRFAASSPAPPMATARPSLAYNPERDHSLEDGFASNDSVASDGASSPAAPARSHRDLHQAQAQVHPQQSAFGLTSGMPTPDAIQRQKEDFARSLELQLKQGVDMLGATHKKKTDDLHANANQQKHQFNLQLDQQVKQQEMVLSQQYNQQLMMLQQAAQQQRAELEQQASALTLEWQQRKTHEEFLTEQVGIQKRYSEVQQQLAHEMDKINSASTGSMLLPPQSGPSMLSYGSSVAPPLSYGSSVAPPLLPSGGSALLPPPGTAVPQSCSTGQLIPGVPAFAQPSAAIPPPIHAGGSMQLPRGGGTPQPPPMYQALASHLQPKFVSQKGISRYGVHGCFRSHLSQQNHTKKRDS